MSTRLVFFFFSGSFSFYAYYVLPGIRASAICLDLEIGQ